VWQFGGALARVGADETAFGDRSAPFRLGIEANWEDAAHGDLNIAWVHEAYTTMERFHRRPPPELPRLSRRRPADATNDLRTERRASDRTQERVRPNRPTPPQPERLADPVGSRP
jgi:hypothetical protein